VTGPQNKIFIKNQPTLLYMSPLNSILPYIDTYCTFKNPADLLYYMCSSCNTVMSCPRLWLFESTVSVFVPVPVRYAIYRFQLIISTSVADPGSPPLKWNPERSHSGETGL
jgi:hypothetical protein